MNILGIETSCDETSAAVVRDGCEVLSNIVLSQAHLHAPYGGVVPEIASRSHVEFLPAVLERAVDDSGVGWEGIDAVAVTYGPGLASSLLVGLSAAKGLSIRLSKPLYGINHIKAHIYSVFLEKDRLGEKEKYPFLALVVSGGHSCLVRVDGDGQYRLLGQTIDDAAGEVFDKGASLLGLGYPGGPLIDKISRNGKRDYVNFPRGRQKKAMKGFGGLDLDLCFSFSGLKTALLYYLRDNPPADESAVSSVAASYQEAIVDVLVDRCRKAMRGMGCLVVGGGVALNSRLRARLEGLAGELGIELRMALPKYCGDNAAMVAGLAGAGDRVSNEAAMALDVVPNLGIGVEAVLPDLV